MPYTYQQLYEVIYMANPAYTGDSTPDDVYAIFKTMLDYGKQPEQPGMATFQQPQQYSQMQPQFVYNPYLQMQGQGSYNGQVWTYPGYMGVNPYGYRQ